MDTSTLRRPLWAFASALLLALSGLAAAEPPSRVARLGYTSGTVSFSPAGERDWVQASVNRPLTTGDRLWTDPRSRAELQIGGAAMRLGPSTDITLLNLDDGIAQVMLSQGTLKVRVRRMGRNQSVEVNTPNLALTLRRPGEYRIEVDPSDDATVVMVNSGQAEVYGEGASYTVRPNRGYRFYGTGLSDYESLTARRDDDLDRWSRERDRRSDSSASARFVSADVIGYEDLDANGTWRVDPNYGNVWMPTRVASGWTPYRDGHWAWIDPWGWSWVDDAPWGFAVSHYGRWAHINGSWGWVPGPPRERAVYAPALVAFIGGGSFQLSISSGRPGTGAIGWFPLAPREVYQPPYRVSRGYFDNINRSNAVIAPSIITNVYNTTVVNNTTIVNNTTNVVNVHYANQQVRGAVVAVPTQAFVQSQPVSRATVQLSREAVISAPVAHVAAVAPVQQSLHGGARDAAAKPPTRERAVVARTAPPPPSLPFAVQQEQLAAKPGRPIDEQQRKQLKPAAAPTSDPKVGVVTVAKAPTPTATPPATPPAGKSPDTRRDVAARADAANGQARNPDEARANAEKANAEKANAERVNAERADDAKAKASRAEAARASAATAEASRAAEAKAADARAAEVKAAAANADASRAATANAARAEAARVEAAKAEAAKAGAAKAERARGDAARVEADEARNARAQAANAERARAAADGARAKAERADQTKVNASRAEAAQAAAARADANKAAESRAVDARAAQAKASAANAEASRAARANAIKDDAARAEAAKAEATRAGAAKAERARVDAAKVEAAEARNAKAEAANAERARAAADRAEAARVGASRAEAQKVAAARADEAKASRAEAGQNAAARAPQGSPTAAAPPGARASAARSRPDAKAPDEDKQAKEDSKKR